MAQARTKRAKVKSNQLSLVGFVLHVWVCMHRFTHSFVVMDEKGWYPITLHVNFAILCVRVCVCGWYVF